MATEEEKKKSFASKAGEFAGTGYGFAKDQGRQMSGAAGDFAATVSKGGEKAGRMASEFGAGFSKQSNAMNPEFGVPTYTAPSEPAPAAKSAVAPVNPAAETPNQNMPEPQPTDMMADAQGYLPQDYVVPGMLRRPESQGGGDPFAGKGSSFSPVSGPQNDLSVAAQFNKQADMLAAQNARKGPAVYASVGTPGDMSGGGNIGVNKSGGGIQQQIGRMLSSMPYGSAGDRAKRNSILKQADIMMKGYTAEQRTQQQNAQFGQEMAFKEGNAATLAEQYAMGYAQKENQFGQEMALKQQQMAQTQGNVGNQLALDYYKADKMAMKESMPFDVYTEDDNQGNRVGIRYDKRTGEEVSASSPVNEERNMMIKNINDGVKSKKYTEEEGERMFEMMGATRKK